VRRPFRDVVNGFALGTRATPSETFDDLRHWEVIVDDGGQLQTLFVQQSLQGLRLDDCAREPVQDEPSPAMQACSSLTNRLQDGGIGNEFSASHVGQGLSDGGGLPTFGPAARVAEDIASRKVTSAEAVMEEGGLGPLAYSGRA
jgi:hypothetical protein